VTRSAKGVLLAQLPHVPQSAGHEEQVSHALLQLPSPHAGWGSRQTPQSIVPPQPSPTNSAGQWPPSAAVSRGACLRGHGGLELAWQNPPVAGPTTQTPGFGPRSPAPKNPSSTAMTSSLPMDVAVDNQPNLSAVSSFVVDKAPPCPGRPPLRCAAPRAPLRSGRKVSLVFAQGLFLLSPKRTSLILYNADFTNSIGHRNRILSLAHTSPRLFRGARATGKTRFLRSLFAPQEATFVDLPHRIVSRHCRLTPVFLERLSL
jgi:hypothetical protein